MKSNDELQFHEIYILNYYLPIMKTVQSDDGNGFKNDYRDEFDWDFS